MSFNDKEESNEMTFIKGNKGAKNPDKLIVGNKQQLAHPCPSLITEKQ